MKRTSKRELVVNAIWDAEANVWVATSEDVPGLVTESKTFEALLKKLRTLVPELLELNGAMPRSDAPYRVVAERSESVQAAECVPSRRGEAYPAKPWLPAGAIRQRRSRNLVQPDTPRTAS